jgi:hypothetical protein
MSSVRRSILPGPRSIAASLLSAALIAVLMAVGPVAPAWADAIGAVTEVRSTAYGTPPDAPRAPKAIDDPLVFKETLETLSFSALQANLNDGSVVTLGASARIVLDEFVYDPGSGASGLLIDMGAGSLRFVTGSMPKESFQLKTPTATLAVRGTNFKVRVRPNGDTLVVVEEGLVEVTLNTTGQTLEVRAGQSMEIKRIPGTLRTDEGSRDGGFNFDLRELFQPLEPKPEETPTEVTIDGKRFYEWIEFNPDLALDVGNPVVDQGWTNVAQTGAGDKSIALAVPVPTVKARGDRPMLRVFPAACTAAMAASAVSDHGLPDA